MAQRAVPARRLARRGARSPRAIRVHAAAAADSSVTVVQPGEDLEQYSVVMKFGGSSVADAERMREVANIVLSFPEHMPVLVLSAMGKSTNNLLAAGEQAMVRQAPRRWPISSPSRLSESSTSTPWTSSTSTPTPAKR